MFKYFILSLATLTAISAYAQTPKPAGEPGYAVSAKGDTLFGEVSYLKKSGYRQSMSVKLPDQTTKSCSPRSYTYIKAGNNVFISFMVPEAEEKQFFWRKTTGKITLYEYQYDFYQMNNTVTKSEYYIQLKEGEDPIRLNGSNFRKKLEDIVQDNPKVAERIANKDTKLEEIEEILIEYNKGA